MKRLLAVVFSLLLVTTVYARDFGDIGSNKARKIKTDITGFAGTLGASDTTVQQALATLSLNSGVGAGDLLADGTVPMTADWAMGAFDISTGAIVSNMSTVADQFQINQTSAVGTEYVSGDPTGLIWINDDRTGATAGEPNEATIVIDAEGTYALSILDGQLFVDQISHFQDGDNIYQGTGNDWSMEHAINGGGDDLNVMMLFKRAASNTSALFITKDETPNGMTDHEDYVAPTLIITNDEGADANDYTGVVIGERTQADSAVAHTFDFYAMTGAMDGAVDGTTTEIPADFAFGSEDNADILFIDTSVPTVVIGGAATSAGILAIQEDTDDGTNNATFTVPALAADTDYTLPTALPAVTGYVLSGTDAGILSWIVDADSGGAPEGTAVLSTGEGGASKFLREDGDGTSSWQTPAGGGDLLADASVPMTSDWDIGNFDITLKSLTGDGTIEGAILTEGGIGVETVKQQVVTVAKAGGDYTTIQGAIDSIGDNATGKGYIVLIYPGTYTETITMEDFVSLQGVGKKSNVIIAGTITFAADAGDNSAIKGLLVQLTTTTSGLDLITSPDSTGKHAIIDSTISLTNTDNGDVGSLIDDDGGTLKIRNSKLVYNFDGTNAGANVHNIIDLTGTMIYDIYNSEFDFDIDDADDTVVGINEAAAGTITEGHLVNTIMHLDLNHGTYTGFCGLFYLHGAGIEKFYQGNHVHLTSAGGGTAYGIYIDTTGNNGAVSSTANQIRIEGFTNNYGINVATGDTVYSHFDDVRAASGNTGVGAISAVQSPSDGNLVVTGLTASEIVITDASKFLSSAAVATYPSLAELAYVKGVSSAIQTQITDNAALVDSAAELLAILDDTALDFGTGILTATGFVGPLTGEVTGNASTVTNGVYTTSKIDVLSATSSAELSTVLSDEDGTGDCGANLYCIGGHTHSTYAPLDSPTFTTAFTAVDLIDSDDYAAGSIDNEHLADNAVDSAEINTNAVKLDALDVSDVSDNIAGDIAEGELTDSSIIAADIKDGEVDYAELNATVITDAAAVSTFASGDTFLCNEAGVGLRECDYDDMPGGAETNSLETVATAAATNEVFVGTGADAGAYIAITACGANEKIEYTDAAPNTFTCETIALTDAEVSDTLTSSTCTGNAATATALTADPADCAANTFADAINASGTLSCNGVVDADVSDTLTASIIDLEAGTITNIATTEIMIGVGAGDASYVALSGDVTMDNTGAVTIAADSVDETMVQFTNDNLPGLRQFLRFNVVDPNAAYDVDTQLLVWKETDAAITITKLSVTCDAAGNEIAGDLKWADAFIGFASAAVIETFDTSSGVRVDSFIATPAVAAGKDIYIQFDSQPNAAITQCGFSIEYDYD